VPEENAVEGGGAAIDCTGQLKSAAEKTDLTGKIPRYCGLEWSWKCALKLVNPLESGCGGWI
jgi:hypothetical protein